MTYVGKKPADIIATAVDTTTGTFSGDLTVDTSTLYVDSANNRVGVGTVSPSQSLHVKGNIDVEGDTSGVSKIRFKAEETHGEVEGINIGTNFGGLAFKTNSNGTVAERMRIDSSGRVMIGNTTEGVAGADELTVGDTSAGNGITIRSASNSSGALFFSDGTSGSAEYDGGFEYNHSSQFMRFISAGSERMRINDDGNVLIGRTSEFFDFGDGRTSLVLQGTGSQDYATIQIGNNGTASDTQILGILAFYDGTENNARVQARRASSTDSADLLFWTRPASGSLTQRMHISSDGNVGIGTSSPSNKLEVHSGAATNVVAKSTNGNGGYLNYSGLSSGGTTTFSVTHNGNVYAADGINLGGTGSANRLDDYEEGTWIPTVSVGTVSYTHAYYTKIGKRVHVSARLNSFSDRSVSTTIEVRGLPFARNTSYDEVAAGSAMWSFVNQENNVVYIAAGGLQFYKSQSGDFDSLRHNDLNNSGSNVYLFATYIST